MYEPSQLLLATSFYQIFSSYNKLKLSKSLFKQLSDIFSINIQVWYYYLTFNKYINDASVNLNDKWPLELTFAFSYLLDNSINDTINQRSKLVRPYFERYLNILLKFLLKGIL